MSHHPFQVCLFEPQIPQNTGNIGRLCVGLGARLVILGQPSFDLSDKACRRAGLDYWPHLNWEHVEDASSWQPPTRTFAVTKYASQSLWDETYQLGDSFVFGRETTGLPESWLDRFPCISIPMEGPIRSFNLANSVAIVLSEAQRQAKAK